MTVVQLGRKCWRRRYLEEGMKEVIEEKGEKMA